MYFRLPFATAGDRTTIPDTGTDEVNYSDGYPSVYSEDPTTTGKRIERNEFNELQYQETLAIQQYQQFGVNDFITTADNGGVPFPYSVGAFCRYDDGGGFKVYKSLVDSNTALPDTPANWLDTDTYLTSGNAVESLATTASQGLTVSTPTGAVDVELDLSGLSTEPTVSGSTTVAIADGGSNKLAQNSDLVSAVVDKTYVDGLNVNADTLDGLQATAFVQGTRTVSAGYGLSGGGALSANISLAIEGSELSSATIVSADGIVFTDDSDSDTMKTGTTSSLKSAMNLSNFSGNSVTSGGLAVTGNITATGSVTAGFSDERLKDIVEDIDPVEALDFIRTCRVARFQWNDKAKKTNPDVDPGLYDIGFMAQDFQESYPEVVKMSPIDDDGKGGSISGENWLTMAYDKTPAVAFAAIKALIKRVEQLEDTIERLS
jgi:hypothetical protein